MQGGARRGTQRVPAQLVEAGMQADLLALVHSELLIHRSVKEELHHAALVDWCLVCKASRHPVEQMSRRSLQQCALVCAGYAMHWSGYPLTYIRTLRV